MRPTRPDRLPRRWSRSVAGVELFLRGTPAIRGDEVATVFDTSLLQHIGCTGYAHESYLVWGDDLAANRASQRTNFAEPADLLRTHLPTTTGGERYSISNGTSGGP